MKYSLKWLRDYCPANLPPDKLAQQLTMAGLEVESLGRAGDDVVFDVEVVPVRSDCLSMVGLAREISFLTWTSSTPTCVPATPPAS